MSSKASNPASNWGRPIMMLERIVTGKDSEKVVPVSWDPGNSAPMRLIVPNGGDKMLSWSAPSSLEGEKQDKQDKGLPCKERPERRLTLIKMIAITCATVAGGPYGFEDAVGAGGPAATISMLMVVPFFWSIPLALMTAELACMIPENGGHILWVDKAFGPFWSFQNSYLSLLCAVFEGGLMPVMFMDYLSHLIGMELSPSLRVFIGICVLGFIALINIFGTDMVGSASVIMGLIGASPFIAMVLLGLPYMDLTTVMKAPSPQTARWPLFITILLWNTSGYDSVGACAGEVKNPSVNFPKAVLYSVAITIGLDIIVLGIGISVYAEYATWQDGTFVRVAHILGGNTLAFLFAFGASVSAVGLLCALLCTSSRIVYGMAVVGTLPKVFAATHPKFNTPYVAMVVMAVLMAITTFLPFAALAEAEMWFYCLSTVLKFASLVRLRQTHPEMLRPYKIPLGTRALQVFVIVPCLCCLIVVVCSGPQTHMVGLAGVLLSLLAYLVGTTWGSSKRDQLISFEVLGDV